MTSWGVRRGSTDVYAVNGGHNQGHLLGSCRVRIPDFDDFFFLGGLHIIFYICFDDSKFNAFLSLFLHSDFLLLMQIDLQLSESASEFEN